MRCVDVRRRRGHRRHANRRFDDVAALTYSDYYHRLHAFASEHAESRAILAAVD